MDIDLMGRTVTQSMDLVRQALAESSDTELVLKTDNEVVKLNLFNQITKLGYPCASERKGPHYFLRVRTGKKAGPNLEQGAKGSSSQPSPARQEKFAFPVREENAHLQRESRPTRAPRETQETGGPENPSQQRAVLEPTSEPLGPRSERMRSSSRRSLIADPEPGAGRTEQQPANPRAAGKPLMSPAFQSKPLKPEPSIPQVQAPAGQGLPQIGISSGYTGAAGSPNGAWLIVQHDQIGERDANLGHQLMEELLQAINPADTAGIFLIHRGARLLDPQLLQGRFMRVLLQKNVPICVCKKSADFYGLEGKLPEEIQLVPFGVLLHIAFQGRVIWL